MAFVTLSSVGGASGADFSKPRMEKVWESMRIGYKFGRKKENMRAFVFSADLFVPNVLKYDSASNLSELIAMDTDRMKRIKLSLRFPLSFLAQVQVFDTLASDPIECPPR